MHATHTEFDISAVQASWQAFDATARLYPIRDEEGYDRTVTLMNSLLDATEDDEEHPLSVLVDLVSDQSIPIEV